MRKKIGMIYAMLLFLLFIFPTICGEIDWVVQKKISAPFITLDNPVEKWAIFIGCSGGDDEIMEQVDINTIRHFQDFLLGYGWQNESMLILLEEEATKSAIMNTTFEWLQRRGEDENDIILFFFCMHGQPISEDRAPFDEPDGRDEIIHPWDSEWGGWYQNTYIVDDDLAKRFEILHSKNIIIIFNTCHSGGMIDGSADLCTSGRIVLTSSAVDEPTIAFPTKMQALFPYFIVKGLQGYGDENNDHKVSVEEAFRYSLFPVYLRSWFFSFLLPYCPVYVMHPQMYDGWPDAEDNKEELFLIELSR